MKQILIVDDDRNNLYLLKVLLEGNGYQVSSAGDGQQALEKLSSTTPDLIISDILMPVMDGFLFCQVCNQDEKLRNIPFVFYTATYTEAMDEELAGKLGAAEFIRKPIEPDRLVEIIENVLKTVAGAKQIDHSQTEPAEEEILKLYNETLVNKLEQKNLDLVQEIKERKRVERALFASEDRYRDLVENNLLIILTHDLEGKILSANKTTRKNLGYTHSELINKNIRDLFLPKHRTEFDTYISELKTKGVARGVSKIITKDGRVRIWEYANTLRTEGVENPIARGTATDITERIYAEKALAEATGRAIREYEYLLGILNTLARTIGSARDINAIFEAILEFTSETISCDALIISVKETDNRFNPLYFWFDNATHDVSELGAFPTAGVLVDTAIETGEVLISPTPLTEPDQKLKSALVVPMKIKGDVIGVIEVQNFEPDAYANEHRTAMRMAANLAAGALENVRLLEQDHKREEQMKTSQRLESLGRLAGGIAHDFNNMLTAINGYSELALKRLAEDDPIYANLLEIKKAGERSADLTRQLLTFSRHQVLQFQVLDLNEIISDTITMLQRLIGEDLRTETVLDPNLGFVESDRSQISQVIINLAVNARDAMPDGGTLTIKTSNTHIGKGFAENYAELQPGPYILLMVSDTGIGIEKGVLEKIFEPFFTTKVVEKGTGLGLATVYGIVKQSNGHIFVDSQINAGTTFKIYLPQVDNKLQSPKSDSRIGEENGGNETILIVEDEKMVRSLIRQVLEECRYKVIEADNGVEALSICEKLNFAIDLVITDIVMPQMGGGDLWEILQRKRPNLRVLFISGYTDDARISDHFLEGKTNFIAKPFSFDELSRKVRGVLDSPK